MLVVSTFVALLVAGTRPPSAALAHAKFDHGTPGPGDVLSTAPTIIDAYFAEDIVKQAGTYGLAVMDASGNQVDHQDTVLDDANRRHMTVTLPSNLAPGDYTVKWWTVSDEDGDAASDTFTFSVSGS
jgi:methionine-rich copper-binding protein CopC